MNTISMTPIGAIHSSRRLVEDDNWDQEQAFVELASSFETDALAGLSDFSHVEILFFMNQVDPSKIEKAARHPRNNTDWPKVGIFAQRGKNRPNQIGSTICRVKKIEGLKLHLEGLDAVDGTPVLDIKPWVKEFAPRGSHRQPMWITELMRGYWSGSFPYDPTLPANLSLELTPDFLAVAKLRPTDSIPAWAARGAFSSISRTADELSIVCKQIDIPSGIRSEPDWRAFKVDGPLDFGLTGILTSIAQPLSGAGISIFAISTFDTDYVLVKQMNLEKAIDALKAAGHSIRKQPL